MRCPAGSFLTNEHADAQPHYMARVVHPDGRAIVWQARREPSHSPQTLGGLASHSSDTWGGQWHTAGSHRPTPAHMGQIRLICLVHVNGLAGDICNFTSALMGCQRFYKSMHILEIPTIAQTISVRHLRGEAGLY